MAYFDQPSLSCVSAVSTLCSRRTFTIIESCSNILHPLPLYLHASNDLHHYHPQHSEPSKRSGRTPVTKPVYIDSDSDAQSDSSEVIIKRPTARTAYSARPILLDDDSDSDTGKQQASKSKRSTPTPASKAAKAAKPGTAHAPVFYWGVQVQADPVFLQVIKTYGNPPPHLHFLFLIRPSPCSTPSLPPSSSNPPSSRHSLPLALALSLPCPLRSRCLPRRPHVCIRSDIYRLRPSRPSSGEKGSSADSNAPTEGFRCVLMNLFSGFLVLHPRGGCVYTFFAHQLQRNSFLFPRTATQHHVVNYTKMVEGVSIAVRAAPPYRDSCFPQPKILSVSGRSGRRRSKFLVFMDSRYNMPNVDTKHPYLSQQSQMTYNSVWQSKLLSQTTPIWCC